MNLPSWFKGLFQQPPAYLVQAKAKVDAEFTYVHYRSYCKAIDGIVVSIDERRPPDLKPGYGNCVAFAHAYRKALGGKGIMRAIELPNDWHVVLEVDGWVLDCLRRGVSKV